MMPSSNILSHQIDTRGFQWELNVVRWKYYVDVWFQGLHCWQSFLRYQIFLTYIYTQVLCLFECLHFIIVSHMGASHFGDVKQAFFQSQMKMTKHVYTDEKTASKYLFTGPTYQLINLSSKSKTKKNNDRIVLVWKSIYIQFNKYYHIYSNYYLVHEL